MKITGISLVIASQQLLDQVSFEIPEGSLFAILGPNGAGKTLLLRCLAGLLKPDQGSIEGMPEPLAWVPLSHTLPFGFVVQELVLMGRYASHQGFVQAADVAKADAALKAVGIEKLSGRSYNSLSRGEQTKVDIARAIASEAKVILLDEPFSNLDIDAVLHMIRLFKTLQAEGRTLIFSHHDLFTVGDLATHALLLKKGRILGSGPLNEVFTAAAIATAYNVRAVFHQHEEGAFVRFQSITADSGER